MGRMFLADDDFPRSISRDLARGHKMLVIEDNISVKSYIDIKTVDNSLVLYEDNSSEETDGGDVYTILCKEFGLVGWRSNKFESKVSVIFLDGGYMLVTLWRGGIPVHLGGNILMPLVGVLESDIPDVCSSDILWVNARDLMQYARYLEFGGMFMYDFEFMFLLGGSMTGGMRSFHFKALKGENRDISLGFIAQYEQRLLARKGCTLNRE